MSLGGAFRVLVSELASVGLDPATVCAEAGVELEHADAFGVEALARVLERAQAAAGDPLLGLHMAERAQGRGALSYLARAQRTVGEGLAAFERFAANAWGSGDVIRVQRRGSTVFVRFQLAPLLPRHAAEYLVGRTAISLRRSGAPVRDVWFEHAAGGGAAEYERVLRCRVRFQKNETGLGLRTADLARPLRTANPDAAATLAAGFASQPVRRDAPVTERLAVAVAERLAHGAPAEREAVARSLGMSGKTLARRLATERRRFRDVVDDVRRTLAERLVGEATIDLGEVAARVGFADLAALGKAFRRWYGESPSTYRARRTAGAAARRSGGSA